VANPKRAFDRAFTEIAAAPDFDAGIDHIGHALGDIYSLFELAKNPPSDKTLRRQGLEASDAGKTALAIAWDRTFNTHEAVTQSRDDGDIYADYYIERYATPVWLPRTAFTQNEDGEGRHLYYDHFLADKCVLDTMRAAVRELVVFLQSNGISMSS
jgi:hypothetical protein